MNITEALSLFSSVINDDDFLKRMIVYCVNKRIQDFADPLTNTLILIMTSPIQIVFCESGILPFKTSLLPVFPYSSLKPSEINVLVQIIEQSSPELQRETMESSGQYTLSIVHKQVQASSLVNPRNTTSGVCNLYICKRKLLVNFIQIMLHEENTNSSNPNVHKTLCNIILQRLMARISIQSEIISQAVECINKDGKYPVQDVHTKSNDDVTRQCDKSDIAIEENVCDITTNDDLKSIPSTQNIFEDIGFLNSVDSENEDI